MATQTTSSVTRTAPAVRRKGWASQKGQEQIIRVVATILCLLGLLIVLFPLVWMLSTSLKTQAEVAKFPPVWIPRIPQWGNFRQALTGQNAIGDAEARRLTGASLVRQIQPGQPVTMDYRLERVTIETDSKTGKIVRASCG